MIASLWVVLKEARMYKQLTLTLDSKFAETAGPVMKATCVIRFADDTLLPFLCPKHQVARVMASLEAFLTNACLSPCCTRNGFSWSLSHKCILSPCCTRNGFSRRSFLWSSLYRYYDQASIGCTRNGFSRRSFLTNASLSFLYLCSSSIFFVR